MPDYIYLLENRLSFDQQNALRQIRQAAREAGMPVFLVGGAVRDLTSGSSVRDLDVAVQGNALKLKKTLEKSGATTWGEHTASRTLFFRFPVGVRVEISSTRREEYPKPGKPVYHWGTIHEDLHRRDFTANAMALSLNEGSYGLLMDPRNGVADIESRILRLVSNYGFIEEPSRLPRAARLAARLAWEMDDRTRARYQTAKEENAIKDLSGYQQGYELEEIGHEEDGLRALAALEAEGWMHSLFPAWTVSKADAGGLEQMHRLLTQLQVEGVNPDPSAISMQFLTEKLAPRDLAALKKAFVRPGFVDEWNGLDASARDFAKRLTAKEAAAPSAAWKLFTSSDPQAVLWLGLTSKSAPVQSRYKDFFTRWPESRQKIPHALMQELRITPSVEGYKELLEQIFFATIDGKLETEEQLRAFLGPYSPPAPPPPVTVRRTRGSRKGSETKAKAPESIDIRLVEGNTGDTAADETREHSHAAAKRSKAGMAGEASVKPAPGEKGPEEAGKQSGSAPRVTAPSPPSAQAKTVRAPSVADAKSGKSIPVPSSKVRPPIKPSSATGVRPGPEAKTSAPSRAIQGKSATRHSVKPALPERAKGSSRPASKVVSANLKKARKPSSPGKKPPPPGKKSPPKNASTAGKR